MKSQTPFPQSTNQLITDYLKQKGYSSTSITSYLRSVQYFKDWLEQEQLEAEQVTYQDGLAYVQSLRKLNLKARTLRQYLSGVRHYYDYLIVQEVVTHHPFTRIQLKGTNPKTLYPVIEPHQLYQLYHAYPVRNLSEKRNKVMLGLLVFQGLQSTDIYRLEVKDIKLRAGMIEVSGSRKTNERTLQVHPQQFMDLQEYVTVIRKEIQNQSGEVSEQLFIGRSGGQHQSRFMASVIDQLRKTHSGITAAQIRASVIVKWLKQYNLRKAQYLAGHRYVSSTEKYLQNEVEGLKQEIEQYHPLG